MKKMTQKSLEEAFAGESMAHMKYLAYSETAEKEGFSNVARLFRAISDAERVHATNHARNLGLIHKSAENLQAAMDGENFEVDEMYPAYDAVAKVQNEKGALQSIHYAISAEKIHAQMYADAKMMVAKDQDIQIGDVYVCPVCGFTHIGEPPDNCPVCNIPKDKFKKF